jgi:hypothetical protein
MLKQGVLFLIRLYQRLLSPLLPRSCRFEPSCSQYAADAVSEFGIVRGLGRTAIRLMKCHPLHPGGYDPVK